MTLLCPYDDECPFSIYHDLLYWLLDLARKHGIYRDKGFEDPVEFFCELEKQEFVSDAICSGLRDLNDKHRTLIQNGRGSSESIDKLEEETNSIYRAVL